MDDEIPVERGSGNVFFDIGLDDPEGRLREADQTFALRAYLRQTRMATARATAEEVAAIRRTRLGEIGRDRVQALYDRMVEREAERERRTERRMLDAGGPLMAALARHGALSETEIDAGQARRREAGAKPLRLPQRPPQP